MTTLKFRVFWEEDDTIYRDISILPNQTFFDLFKCILSSYGFDDKHKATFYRSNDNWQRGREITLEKYDKDYKVEPMLMQEALISSEIKDPNQKFILEYDFNKNWNFLVELIQIDRAVTDHVTYPACVKSHGAAPPQYGTKGIIDSRLAEMEEKYDLKPEAMQDGFGEEGADDEDALENEESDIGSEESDAY
ncbi:MAG TPA: hypothetical protein PLE75_01365 [Ferruginibacter sp.]|nr:hypothetical protein [Ferruginibacter sp.]HRO05305.1 hypothetical protein [Ferruginibacter sp.]HRO96069.1 hypothetical protein [Ferruginibacter sp.]